MTERPSAERIEEIRESLSVRRNLGWVQSNELFAEVETLLIRAETVERQLTAIQKIARNLRIEDAIGQLEKPEASETIALLRRFEAVASLRIDILNLQTKLETAERERDEACVNHTHRSEDDAEVAKLESRYDAATEQVVALLAALSQAVAQCDACDGTGHYWIPSRNVECARCSPWRALLKPVETPISK